MSETVPPAPLHRWSRLTPWPITNSKFDRILELCRGKDVLDCGCVGSAVSDRVSMAATSHFHIAKAARLCVGVDIDGVEIEKRKAMGYNVRLANVEDMDLGQTFDVIVAADVIEHVSNAGRFLERARAHMRPGGRLCIVTPNPWSANTVLKALAGVRVAINPEHTCWYDPDTLTTLLKRYGLLPLEWYWQDYQTRSLVAILTRIRPNVSAHFIVIAGREEDCRP